MFAIWVTCAKQTLVPTGCPHRADLEVQLLPACVILTQFTALTELEKLCEIQSLPHRALRKR